MYFCYTLPRPIRIQTIISVTEPAIETRFMPYLVFKFFVSCEDFEKLRIPPSAYTDSQARKFKKYEEIWIKYEELFRKYVENVKELKGIREYVLPYTWAVGLRKITSVGRGTWKNSGSSRGRGESSPILDLGVPRRKDMSTRCWHVFSPREKPVRSSPSTSISNLILGSPNLGLLRLHWFSRPLRPSVSNSEYPASIIPFQLPKFHFSILP